MSRHDGHLVSAYSHGCVWILNNVDVIGNMGNFWMIMTLTEKHLITTEIFIGKALMIDKNMEMPAVKCTSESKVR